MKVVQKAAPVAVLGAACLLLGACASTMPAPERPNQMGQVMRGGKKVAGVMITVHAPTADHCTYDGAEALRKRDGGFHDFLFVSGTRTNPSEARIDCRTADGQPLNRTIQAPFNEEAFRLNRTATTIGAVLGGGPLGLISGPIAAEMTKNIYRQPPVLIHVPTKDDLATEEARGAARESAVGRWSQLGSMLEKECDAKTRTDKKVVMAYACPKGFFSVLRDVDLAIYNAFAPSPEPAVAKAPETTAAPETPAS